MLCNRWLRRVLLNVYILIFVLGMGSLEPSRLSSAVMVQGEDGPLLPILRFPGWGSWASHLEAPK